jgi:hypothetical protein
MLSRPHPRAMTWFTTDRTWRPEVAKNDAFPDHRSAKTGESQ